MGRVGEPPDRVNRGSMHGDEPAYARSSDAYKEEPTWAFSGLGFRIAYDSAMLGIVRGGSSDFSAKVVCEVYRYSSMTRDRIENIGFRLVHDEEE